ncbi:prolyl oligopeptidase family serine peptidase [Georgenia sp. TF02-10]|uniref:alpha/beta hydrolase family protein n=1 Tax=Georgenia sp. TF02-10 TaxID=2917725 RepID=UPI001FA735C3|nr:prolyl oligopeptidase family serine peptidase [Georgenia sp. TF02-10]UNX55221.1 prolyl oligopeptidase family serine peptidase [Georgenia sp. TF02-10]
MTIPDLGTWPPPTWELRLRAHQVLLPDWAPEAPDRACVVATHDGVLQVHSWDRAAGRLVVATDRPQGTTTATIDPHGAWLWWFDDTDGDEFGRWRRQPFGSPPGRGVADPIRLPDAYDAGLLLARDGTAVVGRTDATGTWIHQVAVGAAAAGSDAPVLLYHHPNDATAAALSHDGDLVVIEHSERGDNRHPALRVVRTGTGTVAADLDDGPGRGLTAYDFAPVDGDLRVLVGHERRGLPWAAVWDLGTGTVRDLELTGDDGDLLPGEVTEAWWYPGGRAVLVAVDHAARTRLYRHDPRTGTTAAVGPVEGTVAEAGPRPDGDVWLRWSSAATPRTVLSARTGREVLPATGPRAAPSVPARDLWVPGPGGPVHVLLRVPGDDGRDRLADSLAAAVAAAGPFPLLMDLHGGPAAHRSDAFSPHLAAWVDHGFVVASVNYRGSTGYGTAWRDALEGRVGRTELADVAAAHDHLLAAGLVDPARCVLAGASWGGFLTLLGLGTQPERWAVGLADVPVADYLAAYREEMPDLQAFDRSLFGGSPAEVPERYAAASPITYVDRVRAPVLLMAGENDPRCPIGQIDSYVQALRARPDYPGPVELYTYAAGHASVVVDEEVAQLRRQLAFVAAHLPAAARPTAAS